MDFAKIATRIIIVAAIVALVVLALHLFGIVIPAFIITACWIVGGAIVLILAVRLISSWWV